MILFPHISPLSGNVEVWKFEEIERYTDPGIYVFWGKDKALKDDFEERHSYEYQDLPLYIGRADNLAERVMDHIKGKTHTKHFCGYFYTVDLFDLSQFEAKDHRSTFDLETDVEFKKIMDDNQLTARAMSDLYELYFIMSKLPLFNGKSNHFTSKDLIKLFFKDNHHKTLHRREWAKYAVYEKLIKCISAEKGYIKEDVNAKDVFDKHNIKLELWYKEDDFIGKIASRWSLKKDSDKAKELEKIIKRQIKDRELDKLTIDYTGKTVKVSFESVIFYEQIYSKEDFKNDYRALGKVWK